MTYTPLCHYVLRHSGRIVTVNGCKSVDLLNKRVLVSCVIFSVIKMWKEFTKSSSCSSEGDGKVIVTGKKERIWKDLCCSELVYMGSRMTTTEALRMHSDAA